MHPLYVIWGYNCFILDSFSTQMMADLKLAHELSSIQASIEMKNDCPRLDLNFGPTKRKLYLVKSTTVQHRMTLVRLATLSDILVWGTTTLMIHCN